MSYNAKCCQSNLDFFSPSLLFLNNIYGIALITTDNAKLGVNQNSIVGQRETILSYSENSLNATLHNKYVRIIQ